MSNKIRNESLDIEVNSPNNMEVHLNNLLGKGANAPELVCCRAVESPLDAKLSFELRVCKPRCVRV